ncbi:hypothetical protein AXF42_Ash000058 [Apostasia shenzhenica]|uniref:Uncharacterized protein n=1 Tax=Apostasia shenzhenica TaxID=1088818 RepID=A0A2I0AFC8_9ASPA|nr:hypothetical protein AXF42_Ash000058 [Apostasia shenzhenica]
MAPARSPSPNPSRSTIPKLLPQECSSAIRKCGSFHPSKTSICSEIPQKGSATKVNSSIVSSPRASFEQKENERDAIYSKRAGVRPLAVNHNKPVKSFMAPTISASSKVRSASPRKKILAERNEEYMKSPCASPERIWRAEETKSMSEIECSSMALTDQNESGKSDFSSSRCHHHSVAHCRYGSPEIASLDADPSLSAYDPMTNYLSPRPRFLHYKPNPRIEQLHGFLEDFFDEEDGRQLEDSFSGSEDDSEFDQPVQPSPLQEVSPAVISSTESETEEVQVLDKTHVLEPESRPKMKKISSLFRRIKLMPVILILIFLLFYVPWSDSPVMSPTLQKNQSSSNPYSNSTFFREVALQDYVINDGFLANPLPKEEFGMLIFNESFFQAMEQNIRLDFGCSFNSTHNSEESVVDGEVNDDIVEEKIASAGFDVAEDNVEETEISDDVDGILDTEGDAKAQNHEMHVSNALEYPAPEPGIVNDDSKDDVEKVEIEFYVDEMKFSHSEGTDVAQNLQEQETAELKQKDGDFDLASAEDIKTSSNLMVEFETMDKIDEATDTNSPALAQDYVFSEVELVIAILGVFAAVLIAITSKFILMKQRKPPSSDNSLYKTLAVVSSNNKNSKDAYGSPTEMSSSANNSLSFVRQRGKKGHDEETLSHERMQRRESGASSSISYGSFTTYEKLSGRKGSRDEEVVTPVRRSSRIRNQFTSP